jgi:hypothetical protein
MSLFESFSFLSFIESSFYDTAGIFSEWEAIICRDASDLNEVADP